MQPEIYDEIRRAEPINWWFVGRRELILDFYEQSRKQFPTTATMPKLLDMGCGTGAVLEAFASRARVFGSDISSVALHHCQDRDQHRVVCADGTKLPFATGALDYIVSLDVVEHIEDDRAVMRELCRICRNGGVVLITVPAHRLLWTTRDERLMHKRRYQRAELITLARTAGFEVVKCSYYCAFFFLPLAAIAVIRRFLHGRADVKQNVVQPAPWANGLFLKFLLVEQKLMRLIDLPFGVSLFCVLRKPPTVTPVAAA